MHKIFFNTYNHMQQDEIQEPSGASDITPDIVARLTSPEGTYAPPVKSDENDVTPPAPTPTQTTPPVEHTPSPMWDVFKSEEGFVMPEAITAENELELLKPFVEKKFGFEAPTLHPLAKQIQELSIQNPNITINDIVNDMSSRYIDSTQMDADDLIRFDLLARHGAFDEELNKNGFTEDDIKEYIAKMTKVEKLEASRNIKSGIDSYNESIKAEYDKELEVKREEQMNTIIQNVKTGVSALQKDVVNLNSVFGVPVNQEQHKVYLEEFEKALTPDKTTGLRQIDEILSNDMLLYKMYLTLVKHGEEKVMEYITKGKETAKEELFKKLEITPISTGSNKTNYQGKEINFAEAASALSSPER